MAPKVYRTYYIDKDGKKIELDNKMKGINKNSESEIKRLVT